MLSHTYTDIRFISFHLKRFFSAYISEVKKVYFMSRSFTKPAFSRTVSHQLTLGEMVIIFKMVMMVEMVKKVEMAIMVVMAMIIRLSK